MEHRIPAHQKALDVVYHAQQYLHIIAFLHQFEAVKSMTDTSKQIMNDEQIIDQIIHSFLRYNLRDIQEINNNQLDFTIAEFILCSCLIDQISGFRYNIDKVGKRYKQFVKDYLPNYNPNELYDDLRNKLVHNYSIGSHYRLIRKAQYLHLEKENGNTYLNLENFIADIRGALDKYFFELRNDADIKQNALSWYQKHKIIGQSN